MKLKVKDLVGSLLVLAIAVPYIGYLLNGEMPFVEDPRGMSAVGLVLGAAAFLVLEQGEQRDKTDTAVRGLAVVSAVLGVLALALAETGVAEVLLAVFMGSILVVWAVKVMDHARVLPMTKHPVG